jgi:hypothetical protein
MLGTSCGESWNALNPWSSSKLGFDVPLAMTLCKTFLLRMLSDSWAGRNPTKGCSADWRSFQNNSTKHYQYNSKAAVIKLSFWVRWHVVLLMRCRLQELEVYFCYGMTDRGLLEGIGSLHELSTLCLTAGHNLTAQTLSTFLHRPSMSSIVLLNLSACSNLDDEGLRGIAKRCNKLIYLPV